MRQLSICVYLVLYVLSGTTNAQSKVLVPEEMHQLIPHYVKEFQRSQELKGKLVTIGNLQYSVCEQSFSNPHQRIKVLLFDFKDAQIMYRQATKEWQNFSLILTDTLTRQMIAMTNCSGWQSFRKNIKTSEIYLGVCDRFFLTLTGEGVELETLKSLLNDFHFDKFPK
jgi:hypothetical protein